MITFADMKRLMSIMLLLDACVMASAQTDFGAAVRFDRTVYDFGDIMQDSGPVSCSFVLTNISDKGWTIDQVASSCGCTEVRWSRAEIAPGQNGNITATYSNDEGPYPFDKTLTVYVSALGKPVVLHLRGVVRSKSMSLSDSYPVHYGPLAFRDREIRAGNMVQGESRTGEITVANISSRPIVVSFENVSPGLSIRLKEKRIRARGTGTLIYTVESDRGRWGENCYYATPLINGKSLPSTGKAVAPKPVLGSQAIESDSASNLAEGCRAIAVSAVTRESFSASDYSAPPVLETVNSTFSFGKKRAGTPVRANFALKNTGKKKLLLYKVEPTSSRLRCIAPVEQISTGEQKTLSFELNTAGLEPGEHLFIVNLYSNAPGQSVRSIYITGILE